MIRAKIGLREKARRLRLSSDILPRSESGGYPIMLDLQREQFDHDERFHRDIARLSVHSRLNHMALHFCKYTGQFATVCGSNDSNLRSRTIIDLFVISLCSANALNFNLSEHVAPTLGSAVTLRDIGAHLAATLYQPDQGNSWLFSAHAIQAGRMARACEKIDHLEGFPFREELSASVLSLCQLMIAASSVYEIDLCSAVRERRQQIRNPFIVDIAGQKH